VLDETQGTLPLPGRSCPAWVVPNADGAGYFRFSLDASVLAALRAPRFARLAPTAQLVLVDSLEAAFRSGALSADALLSSLGPLATSDIRQVATTPMDLLELIADRMVRPEQRGAVHALGRRLYRSAYAALGWEERGHGAVDGERELLRAEVVRFMALGAEDPRARADAWRRARAVLPDEGSLHLDAVSASLIGTALAVGVQEGGAPYFDRLLAAFRASDDAVFRGRALTALGSTRDPELAARARALALDPSLRLSEVLTPLWAQLRQPETRAATWAFVLEGLDALVARLGSRADHLPRLGHALCSEEDAVRLEATFAPRVAAWPSGPRALAGTVESIRLCAALVEAQGPAAQRYFDR